MADFYDEMGDMVQELLAPTSADGLGQGAITLTRPGTTTPGENEWDPPIEITPTTVYPLKAVAKGVSKEFIDGTTIVATDLEITAAVFGATPDLGDVLSVDGKALTVILLKPVPPAGTVVAWKWIARG